MWLSPRQEERVRELAEAAIHKAAPGVLSINGISEALMEEMGVSRGTVRRYVRLGIDAGHYIELKPDSQWRVTWPGLERAQIGVVYLNSEVYDVDLRRQASRLYLAHELQPGHRRKVGPGCTTFVITPGYAQGFIQRVRNLHRKGILTGPKA